MYMQEFCFRDHHRRRYWKTDEIQPPNTKNHSPPRQPQVPKRRRIEQEWRFPPLRRDHNLQIIQILAQNPQIRGSRDLDRTPRIPRQHKEESKWRILGGNQFSEREAIAVAHFQPLDRKRGGQVSTV